MSLKEQIHSLELQLSSRDLAIEQFGAKQYEMIEFMTGKSRVTNIAQGEKLVSMPRRGGIGDRIRHAEAIDRQQAAPLVEQRKKEYEERINAMMPEVEVVNGEQ